MVIMVIKQTKVCTDLCIGKLAAVLDGSVFCGFHGCTAWLAISAAMG